MKITKRQLRRIIKEERSKLLVEMNPTANAERTVGLHAPTSRVATLKDAIDKLQGDIVDSVIEDGLEEDEAEEMAADAVMMVLSNVLLDIGMVKQSQALIYMLSER